MMLNNITVNLNVLESMIYFWEASKDGEKVGEPYIMTISEDENMKLTYDEEFNEESVRRALSAISNREIFSGSKLERKFWNNNMWMMDDFDFMRAMIQPIKTLNLANILDELKGNEAISHEQIEVIFLPLHIKPHYVSGNKLIMNFFKVQLDFMDFSIVNFEGQSLEEYIKEAIVNM